MTEKRLAAAIPIAGQVVGTAAALLGLYLLVGLAWTLLASGIAVVGIATLAEMRAS